MAALDDSARGPAPCWLVSGELLLDWDLWQHSNSLQAYSLDPNCMGRRRCKTDMWHCSRERADEEERMLGRSAPAAVVALILRHVSAAVAAEYALPAAVALHVLHHEDKPWNSKSDET